MNWQHLVYFRKIVEKKNFSKAADSLYIAPSTLSKAIRSLEEEIGFPLFEKQGRNSTYEVARRTPEATVIIIRFGIVLACKLQI